MRLIDANALNFEKLQDTNGEAVPANEYIAFLKGAIAAEELIKNAPTIDSEPVVRCKDCKYFTNNIADENLRKNFCDRIQINCFHSVKENDYCSYGTKVDEDKCET